MVKVMALKVLEIDFEYSNPREPNISLVCCSIQDRDHDTLATYWLVDDEEKQDLIDILLEYKARDYVFLSYAVMAEARSLLNLALHDVETYKWIDLYTEWRMTTNHNHKLQYGKQLIDGREVTTFPPKAKYEQTANDKKKNSAKVQHSMAAAAYKLLGEKVDTDHKTAVRDIIIRGDKEEIQRNRDTISLYCESDLKHLKPMLTKIVGIYKKKLKPSDYKNILKHMLWRGEYAARTAKIEQLGYPIDYTATKNFSDAVPSILRDIQEEINDLFPDIMPFKFNKRTTKSKVGNTFSWRQKETKEWIKTLDPDIVSGWLRTDKDALSLSLEAFTRFFPYRHDFPKHCLGAQMVRYLKMKQQLNGFMPAKKGKKNFFSSLGSDNRSRPFLGIYGSQSARNQPSATGFLFLKSAWMRALCMPPKGRGMCAIDFGSEEFLIGGILSGDQRMIDGYHTGDPYLYFGKAAGAIPQNGTKKSHSFLRNKFKSTTLGIQYLMGAKALALKLTNDTGVPHTKEEAQDLIDLFEEVFHVYSDYREDIVDEYDKRGYLQLSDGWTMFGDNNNFRSIANCPVQGEGSVVLRKMVQICQDRGLDLALTLHDAGYIEFDSSDLGKIDVFYKAMGDAFKAVFPDSPYNNIRLDANVWGLDFPNGSITTPNGLEVKSQTVYIDERAEKEYNNFKHYFQESLEDLDELL